MNKTCLVGRTTDKLNFIPAKSDDGKDCGFFTLAVKDQNDSKANFIKCVVFGKLANLLNTKVGKGSQLGIEGHITTNKYNKEGKELYSTNVVCDRVEFLQLKATS